MISAAGLSALVVPALALATVTPIVLIYLVWRDVKEKSLW
ncbi:hypothetical protein SAMN04488071_2257 [Kordiimonas lacus]|jgi:hypothetical protein|uniref:Uncharacterized protein n=1 Tax=Kordiimonas lacus TaxID=637679 RepID=A0A1G7AXC8_9PROT|nr:hypothetical protein SAMN04488071_2257 [Kordiimonas lacus]